MARYDPDLAREARVACEKWRSSFQENIDKYHRMTRFVKGEQWDQTDQDDMLNTFRKTPLTCNMLGTFDRILRGEFLRNTPQLQVQPLGGCTEEEAQVRDVLTKDIMFSSDSKSVYGVVAGQSGVGGYSAFLWDTQYPYAESFDPEAVVVGFKDPTKTYFDQSAEHRNKIDGMHCGYWSRMNRKKFSREFGKDIEQKISNTGVPGQQKEEIALAVSPNSSTDPFTWSDNDSITVNHYYKRVSIPDVLYKLSDYDTVTQKQMEKIAANSRKINAERAQMQLMQEMSQPDMMQQQEENYGLEQLQGPQVQPTVEPPQNAMMQEEPDIMTLWNNDKPVRILKKKNIKRYKVMHYKIAGDYILDEQEFPSEHLPLIFVDQDSWYDKEEQQKCKTFYDDAVDTQRFINFNRTQSAYILKVMRYDQYMGSKKNVQSLDSQRAWGDPMSQMGLLPYDESPNGHKPEPMIPPELSASLQNQYQMAKEDMYTCTGLYPARMGNSSDDASGVANNTRSQQGSIVTEGFRNSINQAIEAGGIVLNEMIPRVYDTERVIKLMMPDKGMQDVTINKQMDEYSGKIENDMRRGTYKIKLIAGPSWEGQQMEALRSLQLLYQVDPSKVQDTGDLFVECLPLPNNIELKNRIKARVPRDILEAGKTGVLPPQQGPSPEQQAMAMEQQKMQQDAAFKQKELELKERELELEKQEILLEAQFKIQKLQTDRLEAAGRLKEQELRYLAETERTESDSAISHANNLVKILTHKVAVPK